MFIREAYFGKQHVTWKVEGVKYFRYSFTKKFIKNLNDDEGLSLYKEYIKYALKSTSIYTKYMKTPKLEEIYDIYNKKIR